MLRESRTALSSGAGSVLLYIVFVIVLLSCFAAGAASQAMAALSLSERLSEQLQAAYVARGAVQVAVLTLARDDTPAFDGLTDGWAYSPGIFAEQRMAGGTFRVTSGVTAQGARRWGLADEERRVNLNTAPPEWLKRLFIAAAGVREREAEDLAAAIADWRDPDTDERSGGAERFYYQSLRDAYDCKDGPFENVEELLLLRGMTPAVYRAIEPLVTVHSIGPINLNTAGETVLRALGLSESGLAGFLLYRSGEDSAAGTPDDRQLTSIAGVESELSAYVPAEDLARLAAMAQERLIVVFSKTFRMTATAEVRRPSSRAEVRSIIDRSGRVLHWQER